MKVSPEETTTPWWARARFVADFSTVSARRGCPVGAAVPSPFSLADILWVRWILLPLKNRFPKETPPWRKRRSPCGRKTA